jgi:hypothetical protein
MNTRILYATPEGGVAIIIPTGELPAEVVARKDVPQGVAYKIVNPRIPMNTRTSYTVPTLHKHFL